MFDLVSENDFIYDDNCIRVLGVIDDRSQMLIKKKLKTMAEKKIFLELVFYEPFVYRDYVKKQQMKKTRLLT